MKNSLIILMLIILSTFVFADSESYMTSGVSRDNTYVQEGNGQWLGKTAIAYQRTGSFVPYSFPLVSDLDFDGVNEIIMAEISSIQVLNFTSGVGLLLKDDYDYGTRYMRATPYLMDYDSDGSIEIIYFNNTNLIVLNYSNGTLSLEQTAVINTSIINSTGTVGIVGYFSVKCAPAAQTSIGKDSCIIITANRTGALYDYIVMTYNLDDNDISYASTGQNPTLWSLQPYHNIHLADGDGDGYLEAYFSLDDAANGNFRVVECELSGTCRSWNTDDRAAGTTYTDIVINRLDGVNSVATWGYMISNNMYAKSVKIPGNTTLTDGYVSILSAPEGNYFSENLVVADDTTYCDYSGDVYLYVRNYDQSDPGVNKDTVFCLSQYAGAGYKETVISNTNRNDTHRTFTMHQVNVYGVTGLLLSQWGVQGGTKENLPTLLNEETIIPVDYERSGSIDLIGMNSTKGISYYDDNYINNNYAFTELTRTPNPLCLGYTYTFTLTTTDTEGDSGDCYGEEKYQNGTVAGYFSNQSINELQMGGGTYDIPFYYYGDEADSRVLTFYCRDQYHAAYVGQLSAVLVVNSTLCNDPTAVAVSSDLAPANATTDNNILISQFNEFAEDFGIMSKLAKGIIALIIIMILCSVTAISFANKGVAGSVIVLLIGLEAVVALIIFYWIGWVSAVPLIIIGLICAMVIVGFFFGKSNNLSG